MTLEVEMPHPDMPGMKQKGRVYVCDLAGTEPAGDIVFAKYEKKVFPNGDIEHKFIGAHEDDRKTKELQVGLGFRFRSILFAMPSKQLPVGFDVLTSMLLLTWLQW